MKFAILIAALALSGCLPFNLDLSVKANSSPVHPGVGKGEPLDEDQLKE